MKLINMKGMIIHSRSYFWPMNMDVAGTYARTLQKMRGTRGATNELLRSSILNHGARLRSLCRDFLVISKVNLTL